MIKLLLYFIHYIIFIIFCNNKHCYVIYDINTSHRNVTLYKCVFKAQLKLKTPLLTETSNFLIINFIPAQKLYNKTKTASMMSRLPSLYWYFCSVGVAGAGLWGLMFSASSLSSFSSHVSSTSSAGGGATGATISGSTFTGGVASGSGGSGFPKTFHHEFTLSLLNWVFGKHLKS